MNRERPTTVERLGEGLRAVTPAWLKSRENVVASLANEREANPSADTTLIVVAAQHPLIDGVRPGEEFTMRLDAGVALYKEMRDQGRKAHILVTGHRHEDPTITEGQTKFAGINIAPDTTHHRDEVTLSDAGALYLLGRGDVNPADLRGKDFMDKHADGLIHNGAEEIRLVAEGFREAKDAAEQPIYEKVTYVCAPGQKGRANTYALAHGVPMTTHVPEAYEAKSNRELFHEGAKAWVVRCLTRTLDPYGGVLGKLTCKRIPANPNSLPIHTQPGGVLAELPWYKTAA